MSSASHPLRRAASAIAAGLILSGAAMAQQAGPLLDPALCTDKQGWIDVAKDFVNALAGAGKAGRLQPQEYTDLSVWFQQLQTYLLNTGNTKGFCEALIEARIAHKF